MPVVEVVVVVLVLVCIEVVVVIVVVVVTVVEENMASITGPVESSTITQYFY